MIHGELEDPGCEFFIQTKSGGSSGDREIGMGEPPPRAGLHDKVLHRLFAAKASTADQYKSSDHTTSTGGHPSSTAFDWSTSYSLSLDKIASSHVSPRIASKILFAGKAVKLLQASGSSAISSSTHNTARSSNTGLGIVESEAYRYLSSGAADVAASTAAEDESAAHIHNEDEDLSGSDSDSDCVPTAGATDTKKLATTSLPVSHTREAFKAYVETGGFTVEDTVRFTTAFSEVLAYPDQAVELLESAVEAINDAISNRLWVLLRDSFGFLSFLQVIRSTYLLGRGELFQSLLDGILTLTYAATPEPLEMDNILNWKVLRTSAKLIGLESDDSLNDMIQLRVNHADLNVKNFALHTQDLQLIGAAVEVAHVIPGSSMGVSGLNGAYISKAAGGGGVRAGQRSMVELCRPAVSSSFEQFEHIWSQFLRKKVAGRDEATMTVQSALHQEEEFEDGGEQEGYLSDLDGDSLDGTASPQHPPEAVSLPSRPSSSQVPPKSPPATKPLRYTYGILSLADQKHVTRGFNWCTTFMCGWNELRVHLTPNHACFRSPAAERQSERVPFPPPGSGARVVTLGSIACSLRGDKKAQLASNLRCSGGLVGGVGNLTAGASFHGECIL